MFLTQCPVPAQSWNGRQRVTKQASPLVEGAAGMRRKVTGIQHGGRCLHVLEPLRSFGLPLHHRAPGMLTIISCNKVVFEPLL